MSSDLVQTLTEELEILNNIFVSDEITQTSPLSLSIKIVPKTGADSSKITSEMVLSMTVLPDYPFACPSVSITSSKGLDDSELESLSSSLLSWLSSLCSNKAESDDSEGERNLTYTLVFGVCLDDFEEGHKSVRLDECYHRFHAECVSLEWFAERSKDIGYRGDEVECEIPAKKCPVCRRDVDDQEAQRVLKID